MKATGDLLLCMLMAALFGLLLLLRVRFPNASRRAETVALSTGLGNLTGMAIDGDDNLYISESVRVDKISKDGRVTVITGFLGEDDDGNRSYLDGPLAGAGAIALDDAGRVYISLM